MSHGTEFMVLAMEPSVVVSLAFAARAAVTNGNIYGTSMKGGHTRARLFMGKRGSHETKDCCEIKVCAFFIQKRIAENKTLLWLRYASGWGRVGAKLIL